MFLRKTINEKGEICYIEISFEEAIKLKKEDIVFTSEVDEDRYDDYIEDLKDENKERKWEDNPFKKEFYSQIFDETFKTNMKGIGEKIKKSIHDSVNKTEENSNKDKISKMLHFMDDDDIKDLVKDIFEHPENYKGTYITDLFPYLSDEDADKLFVVMINDPELSKDMNIKTIVPYVSEDCLDYFVDRYINGEFQNVDIDTLYPFFSSSSIKKLFKHLTSKN